jgi:putative transcriptional regulator
VSDRVDSQLGNRLKQVRLAAGLTQGQLAGLVGVSRKTINTVENRIYVPSTALAFRISHALSTSVDTLFYLEH